MHNPIAFTYDADFHCSDCAEKKFGRCKEHNQIACCVTDSEGNEPHAVFWDDSECGSYCGDCGYEISEHPEIDAGEECPYCGMEGPEKEPEYEYRVVFTAYCGMTTYDETFQDLDDALVAARGILSARESQGYEVEEDSSFSGLHTWEILEPDNCALVPDECGWLTVNPVTA